MENGSKVFVLVEDETRTFEDAVRFGEIEFLVPKDFNIWRPAQNATILREVAHKLRLFQEKDYLVLIGSPILIGYAFQQAAKQTSVVKVLQWDRRGSNYVALSIDTGGR